MEASPDVKEAARAGAKGDGPARVLEAVGRIAVSISRCLDLDALLAEVVASVKDLLDAEAASVLLTDHGTGQLVFHHVDGGAEPEVLPKQLVAGEGVAGWVAEHRASLVVSDVSRDGRFTRRVDQATGFETRSVVAAPLVLAGELIGVIEVLNRRDGGRFGPEDGKALEALAPHVAVAVQNARVTAALQRRTVHLERELKMRMAQVVFAKKEIERTIDAIDEPIVLVEPGYRVRRANLAVARRSGMPIPSVPGSPCYETIFGRSSPCTGCPLSQALAGKAAWANLEFENETYLASHFPIDDGEGNIYAVVCSYRDLTESRNMEHRLREAERMASVGQLAAGVAHEINNPMAFLASNLSTLRGYFEDLSDFTRRLDHVDGLMKQGDRDGSVRLLERLVEGRQALDVDYIVEDGSALLDECESGASRVAHIVQQLKSFARERQSTEDLVVVADCVKRVVHQLSPEFRLSAVTIDEKARARFLGCPVSLDQALQAIIRNGLQAAPASILRVQIYDEEGWVCIAVEDEGPGIDEAIRNRIFDPFFTTRGVGGGMGLGLTTAYATVRRYRGSIEVISRSEGGTRVVVKLPAAEEASLPVSAVA